MDFPAGARGRAAADPSSALRAGRAALEAAAARVAALVAAAPDSSLPIPGSAWTVRDAAVHIAGGGHRYAALARGATSPVTHLDAEVMAARARALIDGEPEADPARLGEMVAAGFADLLTATASCSGDEVVAYHCGTRPDMARLVGISLGEALLHGYDLATALGVPWPVEGAEAGLVVRGYRVLLPVLLDAAGAADLDATFRLDVAGIEPHAVRVDRGTCTQVDPADPADCVISADPVTALLVGAGRLSQWPAISMGALAFSGPRPELGPRFARIFRFP